MTNKKNEKSTKVCGGIERPNNDTELVFIIDRSGSMAGFEGDTIGGFNSMIEKQKNEGDGTVYVSTVLFDNYSKVLHDRVPITEVQRLTRREYYTGGCTALLDAVGGAIHHIGNVHKYARREDVPAHTIFIITTDGMENASRDYTKKKVKEMIRYRTEKYGWEFIFVAANIDAIEAADSIGIRRERAANYRQTEDGFDKCYMAMNKFVTMSRCSSLAEEDVSWKEGLDQDESDKK